MCRNFTARRLVYHSRLEFYACCFPPGIERSCPPFRVFGRKVGQLSRELADEIDVGFDGNNAAIVAHFKELVDGFTAIFPVVQCALVDVHADETVGQ